MAATVEGLFKIIDGASGPMRKMELQAKKTDDSIDKLGSRLDEVGSDKQLRQMDSVDRQIKTIDRDATSFSSSGGGGGKLRQTLRDSGDESDRLSTKLGRVGISLASIGKIFSALKLPMMVTGMVALVQGVTALAGGAAALLPKLTDLVGVAGVLPATITGIGIAALSAKLAFNGLGAAMKGTKGAMNKLTPEAREFVRVLKELKPVGKQLQSSAQRGLFPGLTSALGNVQKGVPTAEGLLEKGGQTLGGIANRASESFTSQGFLKDLKSVGNQGLEVVNRMGSGLINLVEALRAVAVAAEPFTTWLSKTVLGWTNWIQGAAEAGRATGALQSYFDRTRKALEQFGTILHNLWDIFKSVGQASRPLGEELWKNAEVATTKWAEFADSLKGRSDLRNWFEGLKESLSAIFDFAGKLIEQLGKLGSGGGFVGTAETLTKALEPLEQILEMLVQEYGPVLGKTVEQFAKLFANLENGESVFRNILEVLNLFLESVNKLLELVPGLSNLIVGVLGAVALGKLGVRLQGIAEKWGMIAKSAVDATNAQRTAASAAEGTMVTGGGIVGGARGGTRTPFFGSGGRIYNTTTPSAWGGKFGSSTMSEAEAAASKSKWFGGMGALGGASSLAGDGLLAAGKFLWPIAAFSAVASAATTKGNLGEKIQGGLSSATLGILPGPVSPGERRAMATEKQEAQIGELLGKTPRTKAGLHKALGTLQQQRRNLQGDQRGLGDESNYEIAELHAAHKSTKWIRENTSIDTHDDTGDSARLEKIKEAIEGLRTEYAGVTKEQKALRRQHQVEEKQRKIAKGGELASGFASGFETNVKQGVHPVEAFTSATPKVLKDIQHLGTTGGAVLAQNYVHWAEVAKKENPKLQKPFEELVAGIETSFSGMGRHVEVVNGRIVEGTNTELTHWRNLIQEKFGEGVQAGTKLMDELKEEALRTLRLMGFSPGEANQLQHEAITGTQGQSQKNHNTSAHQHGGSALTVNTGPGGTKARGGRIPGFGNQDKYGIGPGQVGAAGELIVNKHTEADANAMLGMFGTSLGGMVGAEGRPHSELTMHARGGRRFARGGRTSTAGSVVLDPGVQMTEGVEPQIYKDLQALSAELGQSVYVISGYRSPAHSVAVGGFADDPHTQGAAADIGIGGPSLESMASVTAAQLAAVGLYRQFYPASAHEVNHVELLPGGAKGKLSGLAGGATGAAMGLGGGAAQSLHLKRRKSKLGGIPGAIATAGGGAVTAGYEQRLNKLLGARAGASGIGGAVPSSGGPVISQIGRGLLSHGLNKIGAAGIIGNALQESGWNPASVGSGGGGLWGFTSSPYSLSDLQSYASSQGRPWADAGLQTQFLLQFLSPGLIKGLNSSPTPGAAAAYFMNEWERPAVATENQANREQGAAQAFSMGFSRGGRTGSSPNFAGWFSQGGHVTASGPTLLGIGEGGRSEVASVRPLRGERAGGKGGGGGGITVGTIKVENHRSGDVRRTVEKEVAEAFHNLERELDLEPDTSDEEVLT